MTIAKFFVCLSCLCSAFAPQRLTRAEVRDQGSPGNSEPLSATRISAGGEHTCVITLRGEVYCWGSNAAGQLGSGQLSASMSPVPVVGLTTVVLTVTAGTNHTCAVMESGAAKCWGANGSGQLGNNSSLSARSPTAVAGLDANVLSIVAGDLHSCALMANGAVKCWGGNTAGQLGTGNNTGAPGPVDVLGLGGPASSIAAGDLQTCAIVSGSVLCWGDNSTGQLGNGGYVNAATPITVTGLVSATAISGSDDHMCALTASRSVLCWGHNIDGQLGATVGPSSSVPITVTGLESGVLEISGGDDHTCALLVGGALSCWGLNRNGQIGIGVTSDVFVPTAVTGVNGVYAMAAGDYHTCAISVNRKVSCWGRNGAGQLGNGDVTDALTPVETRRSSSGVSDVAAGMLHTCANRDGAIECWGANGSGQLGDGTFIPAAFPKRVVGLDRNVSALVAGDFHTCALTFNGLIKCWGSNTHGQLGNNSTISSSLPVDVVGLGGSATALVAGDRHTCAIVNAVAKCWGNNGVGQLGDNSNVSARVPIDVTGLGGVALALAAAEDHTCAVVGSGVVKCWGYNGAGQLGNGTIVNNKVPGDVQGIPFMPRRILAGDDDTCVTDWTNVYCWGANNFGQLGNGTTTNGLLPGRVNDLPDATDSLVLGDYHACVLSRGKARCWGKNEFGQIGDGTTIPALLARGSAGSLGLIRHMAAGAEHTCAIDVAGVLYCWGKNDARQVGGTTASVSQPQKVALAPPSVYLPLNTHLALNYFASDRELEPNDEIRQNNGPLKSGVLISGIAGQANDEIDFYAFYLSAGGPLTIRLQGGSPGVTQFQLYRESTQSGGLNRDYSTNYTFTHNGLPGWYYIRVFQPPEQGAITYTVSVQY
jgi:alpha-tubulin suppressor-like RCC1 family protein